MIRTILVYAIVWTVVVTIGSTLCECIRGSCPVPANVAGNRPPPE